MVSLRWRPPSADWLWRCCWSPDHGLNLSTQSRYRTEYTTCPPICRVPLHIARGQPCLLHWVCQQSRLKRLVVHPVFNRNVAALPANLPGKRQLLPCGWALTERLVSGNVVSCAWSLGYTRAFRLRGLIDLVGSWVTSLSCFHSWCTPSSCNLSKRFLSGQSGGFGKPYDLLTLFEVCHFDEGGLLTLLSLCLGLGILRIKPRLTVERIYRGLIMFNHFLPS